MQIHIIQKIKFIISVLYIFILSVLYAFLYFLYDRYMYMYSYITLNMWLMATFFFYVGCIVRILILSVLHALEEQFICFMILIMLKCVVTCIYISVLFCMICLYSCMWLVATFFFFCMFLFIYGLFFCRWYNGMRYYDRNVLWGISKYMFSP